MIVNNITPTDDVSSVSVNHVFNRIGLKSKGAFNMFLTNTLKYIAYHEKRTDEDEPLYVTSAGRVNIAVNRKTNYHHRLMMPLNSANRLIKDFENGLILKNAERI